MYLVTALFTEEVNSERSANICLSQNHKSSGVVHWISGHRVKYRCRKYTRGPFRVISSSVFLFWDYGSVNNLKFKIIYLILGCCVASRSMRCLK